MVLCLHFGVQLPRQCDFENSLSLSLITVFQLQEASSFFFFFWQWYQSFIYFFPSLWTMYKLTQASSWVSNSALVQKSGPTCSSTLAVPLAAWHPREKRSFNCICIWNIHGHVSMQQWKTCCRIWTQGKVTNCNRSKLTHTFSLTYFRQLFYTVIQTIYKKKKPLSIGRLLIGR